jgi:urease subunit beta
LADPVSIGSSSSESVLPGEVIVAAGTVHINENKQAIALHVLNTGDRPVQVGSHFHFFETNPVLEFDRAAARGCHLNVPAGTSVRFEPGAARVVEVVAFGGLRIAAGFRGAVAGPLDH